MIGQHCSVRFFTNNLLLWPRPSSPLPQRLRDRLEGFIEEHIPWIQVNGKNAPRLPNTCNVSCHYVEGEGMLYQLSAYGICASSGSACTSGTLEPSHVLRALNVPFTAIHGSIRFSLSRYNSEEDIDRIIEVFPQIVENLRKLSPYWDNRANKPHPSVSHEKPLGNTCCSSDSCCN